MSRYMGSPIAGNPPLHIPKTKAGMPTHKPNKYADLKPSDQRNTAGQKRHRKAEALRMFTEVK